MNRTDRDGVQGRQGLQGRQKQGAAGGAPVPRKAGRLSRSPAASDLVHCPTGCSASAAMPAAPVVPEVAAVPVVPVKRPRRLRAGALPRSSRRAALGFGLCQRFLRLRTHETDHPGGRSRNHRGHNLPLGPGSAHAGRLFRRRRGTGNDRHDETPDRGSARAVAGRQRLNAFTGTP